MSNNLLSQYFQKYLTKRAKNSVTYSFSAAKKYHLNNKKGTTTVHLLYALAREKGSISRNLISSHNLTQKKILEKTTKSSKNKPDSEHAKLSPSYREAMKNAAEYAMTNGHRYIGTEHLLYGILEASAELNNIPQKKQRDIKSHIDDLMKTNMDGLSLGSPDDEEGDMMDVEFPEGDVGLKTKPPKQQKISVLDQFCDNISEKAQKNKLDPLVGRENEINRLMRILSRKNKNNPLLVGNAGVGKTSIVHGLALKIAFGDVPQNLKNKRLYSLNMSSLIAGTVYRGEFEERLKELVEEASQDDVLLFVDEAHMLVGAGAAQGSLDAAGILKPSLVNGDFQCIAATTYDEYTKTIEKDAALDRRFQTISVKEPSHAETLDVAKRLKPVYERHHNVKIPDEIIKKCVDLSDIYITDRARPDKAIDVLDEACSMVNTPSAKVTNTMVVKAVSEITSIPITPPEEKESIEKQMQRYIVGQTNAISVLARTIDRNRAGARDKTQPVGSFIFLGPSGVGKTETARVLASIMAHQNADNISTPETLVKLDMSEYSEAHTISGLIGAPPGYVGYEESGHLTEKVRKNPYSVVLFDEIEKAHPKIFNILLQIMEDGVLTDSTGKQADFRNTIIILTSNIGGEVYTGNASLGFSSEKNENIKSEKVLEEMKKTVKPEILNRIDEAIVFSSIAKKDLRKLAKLNIDYLKNRVSEVASLHYTPEVYNWIAEKGIKEDRGARGIQKAVQKHIEQPVSEIILSREPKSIRIQVKNKELHINYE